MSRFLKIMIVMLTIAAMAAPAIAEDRLSLGGQMRVRGWNLDDGTNVTSKMDQRLRIGGKFSIAEGVSVTFRTDVTEKTWGDGGSEFGSGRMPQDGQQWDRAHMDLTMGNIHLRAGQQLVTFGLTEVMNGQEGGLRLDINGPVAISGFFMLDDQRGAAADSYFFGANVGHKTDVYSGNVYVGSQTKANDADESVYLIGADVVTKLNVVNLKAELDFFTGDASASTDAVGTQLLVDASMAASDVITVGGQLLYALSADAGEKQYQTIGNDFDGYDPLFDVGTGLSNEQMGLGRVFNAFTMNAAGDSANAGAIGGRLYASMKATDAINLGASIAYLIPEDDANTIEDSIMAVAGGVTYAVMANTSLHAQAEYIATDVKTGSTDDQFNLGVGLFVNF